jgi:protein tyrosine phosphatase (PTP) superfamily phosphohydrolase (DUF442 family)
LPTPPDASSLIPYPHSRRDIVQTLRRPLGTIWLRAVARLMEWSTTLLVGRLNYSDVTAQLAVGGSFRAGQIRQLRERGITAVVDCRQEAEDDQVALARAGMAFLHLPAPDGYALRYDQLREGVVWVLDQLQAGGRAYLHCKHGVGRGPLMACAVLVAQGYSAQDALGLVRTHRWQAMPNDRQLAALLAFERQWHADRLTR